LEVQPTKLHGLDLFSGIGGITLALSPWVRPIAYCEKDEYAQSVLLSRMAKGDLPLAPIWDDVQTLTGKMLPSVDIIYGGFPCQDISVAGLGVGLEGKRSGLFFEIVRLAEEARPFFIFLENVPAIRTRGLDSVGKELARIGYDCRWDNVSAEEVGAPHLRQRWFLLAYSHSAKLRDESGRSGGTSGQNAFELRDDGSKESVANAESLQRKAVERNESHGILRGDEKELADPASKRLEGRGSRSGQKKNRVGKGAFPFDSSSDRVGSHDWEFEPDVGRVAHGVSFRVDRLRSLGNAVVPKQAREAFKRLISGGGGIPASE
jgi:DNA (cytosine-5)-methyltransferase 1